MADKFTPINTQEEFNSRIQERINRLNKKYEGYVSPEEVEKIKTDYQTQIDDLNAKLSENEDSGNKLKDIMAQNEELSKKVSDYELNERRTKIAIEEGIPYDLIDHVHGETEKDIRQDAQKIASAINASKSTQRTAPLASYDAVMTDEQIQERTKNQKYREMLNRLKQ